MTQVTQPYNLFAQTKQQYYPNSQNQQVIVPGNVQGETPEQFAAGKRAANSQSEGYGANPALPTQTVAQQQTGNKGNVGGWTMPQGSFSQGDKPQKTITNVDELAAAIGYTSPQEEDRLRKASLANQRILALGDALRHIGNLAGTVNYAPSQQLNQPWAEEQARYEKGKALRDKANHTYLAYKQAKEAQDAKQKQWEADFNLKVADAARKAGYTEAQIKNMQDRLAEQRANNEANRALRERLGTAQQKERERHNKVAEGQGAERIGIARQNAKNAQDYRQWKMNGGGGRSNPYTLPTKTGYINLGRDLNTNQIGKKALFDEMKKAGIIDNVWQRRYDNMYDAQQQSALLNTAISQWLMTDDKAEDYMKKHFGASSVGGGMDLGLEDDEDEMDLGLE